MKKAGCIYLTFGMESASNEVLRRMGKNYNQKVLVFFFTKVKKAGIPYNLCVIVGHPSETLDKFNETVNFIKENHNLFKGVRLNVSVCVIVPGTHLFRNLAHYNINPCRVWHYSWETQDRKNTFEERKRRVRVLNQIMREINSEEIFISDDEVFHFKKNETN